jgi:hypothetical protein
MSDIKISILCPSRGRPKNLERLIESASENSNNPAQIEFLFYIDDDDKTFIDFNAEKYTKSNLKIITGKRLWISVAHNFLYSQSSGQIVMTAADDFAFRSKGWDTLVQEAFIKSKDNLILVYGSDMGSYGEKMAIYGFFHRDWIDTVGYCTFPGRGSPYDLWSFEVAKKINRLEYLPQLAIEHIHYRQGLKKAEFDSTYSEVYKSSSSWRPRITYNKLKRERWIDIILLCEKGNIAIPYTAEHILSIFFYRIFKSRISDTNKRRLLSMTNFEIICKILSYGKNRKH